LRTVWVFGSSAQHFHQIHPNGLHTQKTLFPDGEINLQIEGDFSQATVYYVQSSCPPVNENLLELLLSLQQIRRSGAQRLVLLMPYFAYARQVGAGQAILALIAQSGIDHLIVLDFHQPKQLEGLSFPVQAMSIFGLFGLEIRNRFSRQASILVSPDQGSFTRVQRLAHALDFELAVFEKRRQHLGMEFRCLQGQVRGKITLIIDDMIDSGETVLVLAEKLLTLGAKEVHVFAAHGLFSGNAVMRLESSPIKRIRVSNSIAQEGLGLAYHSKFSVLDIGGFLASTAQTEAPPRPVSSLF